MLFKDNLYSKLQIIADSCGVGDCRQKLSPLIEKLPVIFGLFVVILVSEYDNPFS